MGGKENHWLYNLLRDSQTWNLIWAYKTFLKGERRGEERCSWTRDLSWPEREERRRKGGALTARTPASYSGSRPGVHVHSNTKPSGGDSRRIDLAWLCWISIACLPSCFPPSHLGQLFFPSLRSQERHRNHRSSHFAHVLNPGHDWPRHRLFPLDRTIPPPGPINPCFQNFWKQVQGKKNWSLSGWLNLGM